MTVPRVSRLLVALLRPTLRAWLWWRFRVSLVQDEHVGALKPPLVILPNHVNFWDPFLVGLTMRYPIYYVAADGNFRSTLMRFLLPKVGGIPKAKARNDMESIRTLQALIARRRAIVLFAEGQRNWDGVSRPVMSGTDKLVRLLGAPVLAVRLRGAYLATPRWARNLRRGPVIIEKELILTPEELRQLPRARSKEGSTRPSPWMKPRGSVDRATSTTAPVGRNTWSGRSFTVRPAAPTGRSVPEATSFSAPPAVKHIGSHQAVGSIAENP